MYIGGMDKSQIDKYIQEKRAREQEQEEQKIFKEFEEANWYIMENRPHIITFISSGNDFDHRIEIMKNRKEYRAFLKSGYREIPYFITPKIHQLLHKLFELWGWFDE